MPKSLSFTALFLLALFFQNCGRGFSAAELRASIASLSEIETITHESFEYDFNSRRLVDLNTQENYCVPADAENNFRTFILGETICEFTGGEKPPDAVCILSIPEPYAQLTINSSPLDLAAPQCFNHRFDFCDNVRDQFRHFFSEMVLKKENCK